MTDTHFLEAWSTTDITDGAGFTADTARRTNWKAKYGYDSGSSFLIGDVTGTETETDPGRLRLSGRDLFYIDPYVMGVANFEYWTKVDASGVGTSTVGAGTFEAKPLAFGGFWGGIWSAPLRASIPTMPVPHCIRAMSGASSVP